MESNESVPFRHFVHNPYSLLLFLQEKEEGSPQYM